MASGEWCTADRKEALEGFVDRGLDAATVPKWVWEQMELCLNTGFIAGPGKAPAALRDFIPPRLARCLGIPPR
jgi:hypothetical protein